MITGSSDVFIHSLIGGKPVETARMWQEEFKKKKSDILQRSFLWEQHYYWKSFTGVWVRRFPKETLKKMFSSIYSSLHLKFTVEEKHFVLKT